MDKNVSKAVAALLCVCMMFAAGCSMGGGSGGTDGSAAGSAGSSEEAKTQYHQITGEEAAKIMEEDENCIIADVRTREEYDEGHIPDAICIPVDTIEAEAQVKLPDKDQTILVYCRSGRRSANAAGILISMGYTKVYDFGGIKDWTGEVVTE